MKWLAITVARYAAVDRSDVSAANRVSVLWIVLFVKLTPGSVAARVWYLCREVFDEERTVRVDSPRSSNSAVCCASMAALI